jgi:hypothetical protein
VEELPFQQMVMEKKKEQYYSPLEERNWAPISHQLQKSTQNATKT